ncbi:MAG TPA: hypothetical protein VMU08_01120 [Rhizomicrobium sp.]|nr:hypothetical protein [Rhizomicrobium sp.]
MKPNLGRLDLFVAAIMLVALAFIAWQVNQTARAMSTATLRSRTLPAASEIAPALSRNLQAIPYCDGPDGRAQNGSHGDSMDGDDGDDDGPDEDAPDDPSQDVFRT